MTNPEGYTALGFVGFTDKGTYDPTYQYAHNDLTHRAGSVWRCLIDNTQGITPTEGANWTLFIGEPTNMAEKIIAPLEDSPSENSYSVGQQLIFNDNLYEVIGAIAVGDNLVTYESDPTNANIKLAPKVSSQIQTLTNQTSDIVNVLGAKNVAPITATTQVVSGVTFDVSDDGIVASGTATADISFLASYRLAVPKSGKYILSKAPSGAYRNSASDYNYVFYLYDATASSAVAYVASTDTEVTLDASHQYNVFINVKSGIAISKTFELMLRPASIVDDTYVPYAMTNVELTNRVIKRRIDVTITDGTNHTATIEPLADEYNPFQCLSYQNQFVIGQRLLYGDKLQVKFEAGSEGSIIPCFVYYRKRG